MFRMVIPIVRSFRVYYHANQDIAHIYLLPGGHTYNLTVQSRVPPTFPVVMLQCLQLPYRVIDDIIPRPMGSINNLDIILVSCSDLS